MSYNFNRFDVYKNDELNMLDVLDKINKNVNSNNEALANKTDLVGDHKGSWQGLNRPTLSDEGMRATVEQIKDNHLVLNVKDFGAKGKGGDDTIYFEKCFEEANKICADVFIPRGIYGLTKTIRIFKPITVYGEGRYSKVIALNNISSFRDDINAEMGSLFSMEYNKDYEDDFYSKEGFIDGGGMHDLFLSGDHRKYKSDGIQLCGVDHYNFYNLSIEEFRGSAIKVRMIRENSFRSINCRYCGLKHNTGENKLTKGHAVFHVVETINDTTNLNNFTDINLMCNFYTALRTFPGNNKWVNIYAHQCFPSMIGSGIDVELGGIPIGDSGKYMDFDVIQLVNTIHPQGATYRTEQFVNIGGVWGGYSSPMMTVHNCIANIIGGNLGGHWTEENKDIGCGIELINSKLRITGTALNQNNKPFKIDSTSVIYANGEFNTSSQELYNNDVQLVGTMQNYNKSLDLSKEQITLFGGKFIGDRHVYEVIKDSSGRQIEIGGRKTNENGGYFREFSGAIRLGDFVGNDTFSGWVGMIYKNNLNEVICQTNGGSVKLGESLHLRDINTIPSNIRKEGTYGFNPITKKPNYWNGSTWVNFGE